MNTRTTFEKLNSVPASEVDFEPEHESDQAEHSTVQDQAPSSKTLIKKDVFFGIHPQMKELQSVIKQIGASEAPVLIRGETGVGKEVFARELHAQSPRSHRRFLKLNCAALPSELVESELFGYERGAFTGAFQRKAGMFELADGGTIFLDEIGDMAFNLQAKLLQVLQDHEFQRLGGKDAVRIDVRVIAATHCDLERAIELERFRQDLFYRLNVVSVVIPPLRERRDDIPALAEILLKKHARPGSPVPSISSSLTEALMAHPWPGNIRELENVMRKLLVLNSPEMVARDLQRQSPAAAVINATPGVRREAEKPTILEQVTEAKRQAETSAILTALESTQWNRKKAALLLKLDYKALLYKMKTLAIEDKMASLPLRSSAAGR